jgi:hypothetical protein
MVQHVVLIAGVSGQDGTLLVHPTAKTIRSSRPVSVRIGEAAAE